MKTTIRGFTLIELMIVVAIIGIVLAVAGSFFEAQSEYRSLKGPSLSSQPVNTVTNYSATRTIDSACVAGYVVVVGPTSSPIQLRDETGKLIKCN